MPRYICITNANKRLPTSPNFFYENSILFFKPLPVGCLHRTTCLRKNITLCLYFNNNSTMYIGRD